MLQVLQVSTLLSSSARCAREVLDVLDVQDGRAQKLLKHKNDYLILKCLKYLKCNALLKRSMCKIAAQKLLKHKTVT